MDDRIRKITSELELNLPCLKENISQFQTEFDFSPPADYIDFMTQSNGGEGDVGSHSYLVLWKIEDIKTWNEGYGVNEFAPELVLFGSDGGDLAYAFDTRFEPVQIVEVPFIGLEVSEVQTIGKSFIEFLEYLACN